MASFMFPIDVAKSAEPSPPPPAVNSEDRQVATSRDTGSTATPDKKNEAPSVSGRRRRGTVAGDLFSNNTNSIL